MRSKPSAGAIRTALSAYIGICAAIALILQGLSLIHQISEWPFISAMLVVGLLALFVARPRLCRPVMNRREWLQAIHPATLPFALVLPLIVVVSIALGWHTPPNNWDAMTYHLSRAAYWRQWHTLAHFPTNNWRQDAFPGNAEVLLLVTLLLAHSAAFAFLVQFMAYLATVLAVFALGRQLGIQAIYAAVGAGAFATMPEVVLQSTSAQNDLTAAAFMLCIVYFLVDAVQNSRSVSVLLAGASLGLAIGTKPTAVLAMPGLCIGAVAVLWASRHTVRLSAKALLPIAGALLAAIALGLPWYVANRVDYGGLAGPRNVVATQGVSQPS